MALLTKETIGKSIVISRLDGEELAQNLDSIAPQVTAVVAAGFGPSKQADVESIRARLLHEPHLVYAQKDSEIVGFQIQSIFETPDDTYLYFARAIRKEYQKLGLGSQLLEYAFKQYKPTVIGARTQNPAALLSFIKFLRRNDQHMIYPISPMHEQGDSMQNTVRQFTQLLEFEDQVDLETGRMRGVYEDGRLGDYVINIADPSTIAIEQYLQSINFERSSGDALFYCARMK